jgi:(p)ppGpp synthase/HD superfamily hydrolase
MGGRHIAVDGRTDAAPWQDFNLVMAASAYAAEAHRLHVRKGTTTVPYLSHLWSVAALVLEQGGDDGQVAAALLHDVVEDHGGTARLHEVRARFGDDVAALVEGLSDSFTDTTAGEKKAPWRERKEHYLRHLATADERVALVSACDKLHNARCTLADLREVGPAVWQRFTISDPEEQLWFYESLVPILATRVRAPVVDELRRTVEAIRAEVDPFTGG